MRLVLSLAMASRAARLRLLGAMLLAACAICLLTAQHASAASWPWTESATSLNLPAPLDSPGDGTVGGTSCTTSGLCVVVGRYTNAAGATLAYVQPITDGIQGSPVTVPLPTGADTSNGQDAELTDVSCQAGGVCEAYGDYEDSSGYTMPMVVQINNGVPAQAVEVTVPADSAGSQNVVFDSISCPVTGGCELAGYYQTTANNENLPLLVGISNGTPGPAVSVALPADHGSGTDDTGKISWVACQATGICDAVGSYEDTSGQKLPLEVTIANGTPDAGTEPSVPPGATQVPSYLDTVACPRSGACQAIGVYVDAGSGNSVQFALPISAGVSGTAVSVTTPTSSPNAQLAISGSACALPSLCVAAGSYDDGAGNTLAGTIVVTPSGASLQAAELPADAVTSGENAGFDTEGTSSVGCVSGGVCLAGGYYSPVSTDDAYNGLLALVTPDGSVTSEEASAPADQSSAGPSNVGPYTYLYDGTSCVDAGSCIATGEYYDSSTVDLPYVVDEQAPLAVSATTLPAATQGTAYPSTTLAATGAWGDYSWGVSAGNLPAGLGLNAQTGVISGTPTGSGTATFTVTVTANGAPVQTATEQLSIAVAAKPPTTMTTTPVVPVVRVLSASGKVSKGRLGVKLSCAGAACAGTVKLEITKVVIVKRGKKKVHKRETVVIGSGHYSVGAGATKTLSVTLDGAGNRALAAARRHRLSATLLATVSDGKSASRHETIYTVTKKKKKG